MNELPTVDTGPSPEVSEPAPRNCSIVIVASLAIVRVHRSDTWSLEFYHKFDSNRMELVLWAPHKSGATEMFRFPPEIKEPPEDAMDILLGEKGVAVAAAGHGIVDLRPGYKRLLEAAK